MVKEENKEKELTIKFDGEEVEVLKRILVEREETQIAIKAENGRVFLAMLNKLEVKK